MIFDKSDEAFVAQAAEPEGRAVIIRRLSVARCSYLVISFLMVIIIAVDRASSRTNAGGAGIETFVILFILAFFLHADAQIKALKLFGRLSPDKSGLR